MKNRAFKGIWIPKEIWLSTDLKVMEKLVLVEIDSLDNEEGCFASNDHFSKFFSLSKNRCSEIIKSLEKKGYITIEYVYQQGSKAISKRVIKCVRKIDEGIREIDNPTRKTEEGYSEKCEDNNINNNIDNNIDINNKKEKKEKTSSKNNKSEIDMLIEEYTNNTELKNTLIEFVKHRKSLKAPMTTRALKQLMNKLNSLATNDFTKIEILNESILNGWKGVFPLKNDWTPINKNKGGFNNESRSNTSKNNEPSKGKSKEEHDAKYWEEQNRILNEMLDF